MEAIAVSKLTNSNWNVWKFQVKVVLMAKGLYEITCGKETAPVEDQDKIIKWKLKDAKAQEALVIRMEDEIISHIMQCETAKEMWQKLENIYERKSEVSAHLLNEQFYNLKFQNETINQFIAKVTNLQAKLKQQGEEIPEKMIITKILMSIPASYRHFRSAWESVGTTDQTLNNLTARLLIEEERLKKEEEDDSTLAVVTVHRRKRQRQVTADKQKKMFCLRKSRAFKIPMQKYSVLIARKRDMF